MFMPFLFLCEHLMRHPNKCHRPVLSDCFPAYHDGGVVCNKLSIKERATSSRRTLKPCSVLGMFIRSTGIRWLTQRRIYLSRTEQRLTNNITKKGIGLKIRTNFLKCEAVMKKKGVWRMLIFLVR